MSRKIRVHLHPKRAALWTLAAGISLAIAGAAPHISAQVIVRGQGMMPAVGPVDEGREGQQGVSVKDSPEALKELDTAGNMARQKDWTKAAGWYQQVLIKYSDRVVPCHTDRNNVIDQYRSITSLVQEALAQWPAEGLNAYRALYDSTASSQLDQAGQDDRAALSHVFETYFITDAGKSAGIRLMNLYIEDGDFAGAAWIGQRLLDWHPNLTVERPRVLYRTALALHLADDDKDAQARLTMLQDTYPAVTDSVFGKDVVLATLLKDQLATAPLTATASDASSWPMFYGDAAHTRLSQGGGKAHARYYSIALPQQQRHHTAVRRGGWQPPQPLTQEQAEGQGYTLGIFPVVDRGEMFFQDGANVFAIDLNTGLPLTGWSQTYPNNDGRFTLSGPDGDRYNQHTITVTEDSVYAVMGPEQTPLPYYQEGRGPARNTVLVCLDRATGAQKWIVRAKDLPGDLSSLDFSGSPLVVGDNVYIMGHGGKNNQFEDSDVLCFDRNTGLDPRTHAPVWSCFIASATTGMDVYWGGMPQRGAGDRHKTHLAYSSGRLFALSDVGALASVDAYTGSIAWLSIYPRDIVMGQMARFRPDMRQSTTPLPFECNPVLYQDGKVFVLPSDSKNVLVYDAASGRELRCIDRSDFGNAKTLLGVVGDRMYLCNDMTVWSLDWKEYQPGLHGDAEYDQCHAWRATDVLRPSGSGQGTASRIRGRAFITADSIYVPYDSCLSQIKMDGGKQLGTYPPNGTWDADQEGPGNVLVTPDYVIIAGARNIDVYTDLGLAEAKLDREVAAAPQNSEPLLRYASMMFAAGKYNESLDKTRKAIDLEGGLNHLRPGAGRDNIFLRTLDFAQKLAKAKRDDLMPIIEEYYDLAKMAAQSPSQQVEYRLDRAQFCSDCSQYGDSIKYYEEVLTNNAWRGVPLGDSQAQIITRQAGAAAEQQIKEIITSHPGSFSPFEAQARAVFDAIQAEPAAAQRQAADAAARLVELAASYPNSDTAPRALIAAVEDFQQAGNVPLATQVAREAYMKYDSGPERAGVIEALVRNSLLQPNRIDIAIGRLDALSNSDKSLAQAHMSGVLRLPDGTVLDRPTFNQALSAIEKLHIASAGAAVPDIAVPLDKLAAETAPFMLETAADVLPGVESLLGPPPELRDFSRYDRLVVWRDDDLAVYPSGQSSAGDKPLARSAELSGKPVGIAWIGDQRVAGSAAASQPAGQPSAQSSAKTNTQDASAAASAAASTAPQHLLVWSEKGLAMLTPPSAAGEKVAAAENFAWHTALASLAPLKVVDAGSLADNQDSDKDDDDQNDGTYVERIGNQTIVHVQNRFVQVYVNGNGDDDSNASATPAEEKIVQVRPAADNIIAATNTGRVFCLRGSDGRLLWQTRLGNHQLDQLCVNADFAAARFTRGNGPEARSHIVVLDTFDGRVLSYKNYEVITGEAPVNMALSPDGLLVWTLPDALLGKDLYEGGSKLTDHLKFTYYVGQQDNENAAQREQRRIMRMQMGGVSDFSGCDKPDQLIIAAGRILAVEMRGEYFSLFSAQTGMPLTHTDPDNHVVQGRLEAYPGSSESAQAELDTRLRVVSHYVYSITSKGVDGYDLDKLSDNWASQFVNPTLSALQDLHGFVDAKNVVVSAALNQLRPRSGPDAQPPAAPHECQLYVFRRSGGLLAVNYSVKDDSAAIVDWQACDGGVYYLSDDHVLHFLRGAQNKKPAK